jgi:hypothetical protein
MLAPISQPDRSFDSWLTEPAVRFLKDFKRANDRLPSYFNGCNYDGADLAIYSYMLDRFRPNRIIEIGSGGSTQFAFWWGSRRRNGLQVIAIDPEPRTVIPAATANVVFLRTQVQDAPLELFSQLRPNDIVFIDSSHSEEEATFHVEQILPRLSPGVVVHHHDIYYPYDIHRDWGEQSVVLNYYKQDDSWEILAPSAFSYWYDQWFYRAELTLSRKLSPTHMPSSLWVRKN